MLKVFIIFWERNLGFYYRSMMVVYFGLLKETYQNLKWTISGKTVDLPLVVAYRVCPLLMTPFPLTAIIRKWGSHSWQCMVLTVPLVYFCWPLLLTRVFFIVTGLSYDRKQGHIIVWISANQDKNLSQRFVLFVVVVFCPKPTHCK